MAFPACTWLLTNTNRARHPKHTWGMRLPRSSVLRTGPTSGLSATASITLSAVPGGQGAWVRQGVRCVA